MRKILVLFALLTLTIVGCYSQRHHGGFGRVPHHAARMCHQPRGIIGPHYNGHHYGGVYGHVGSYGHSLLSPLFTIHKTVVVVQNQPEEYRVAERETVYVKEVEEKKTIVKDETPTVNTTPVSADYDVIAAPNTINVNEMWPISFWFHCNKSTVNNGAQGFNFAVNLENIHKYYTEHPTVTLIVSGYASKNCGTAERNKQLVEERGNYIRKRLEDIGIPSSNIEVRRCYVPEEKYLTNDTYNQCVVVTAK